MESRKSTERKGIRYHVATALLAAPVTRTSTKHTAETRFRFLSIEWFPWSDAPCVRFHSARPASANPRATRTAVVEITDADFTVL